MKAISAVSGKVKEGIKPVGKSKSFELLKRNGKVHAFLTPDARKETLLSITRHANKPVSIVYTHSFAVYDVSKFHQERINHSAALADKRNSINGIKNFRYQKRGQCAALMAFRTNIPISISMDVNGVSIIAQRKTALK